MTNRVKRSAVGAVVGIGVVLAGSAGIAVASADPGVSSPAGSPQLAAGVGVDINPADVVNAISNAVNDQKDRGGAVRAGLDIALTQTQGKNIDGKGPVTAVAIANKNQDIDSQGQIWAQPIDIKGGNYVLYFYAGSGSITNNGDGGWINWGAEGQIRRDGNTIHFD